MIRRSSICLFLALALTACTLKEEPGANPGVTPAPIPAPPDVAAPPADALKTPSGLASKMIRVGLGRSHPSLSSTVSVNYTGWKTDGVMFDSSILTGRPATFKLTQVVSGWTEGLQLMVVGEKRRFWIPGALGYDNDPRPEVPKGMLVFDIELLDIR